MIEAPSPAAISRAAETLRQGGVVAFPTETVYGLGAHGLLASAVQQIYAVKGRPESNPLIFHLAEIEQARELVSHWPQEAEALATAFWPGPLTLVLPVRDGLQSPALAGGRTIALRIPDHPVARQLLHEADVPVVAPSANRSGTLSPVTAQHVWENFHDNVPTILDGGSCLVGIESTVVDLCSPTPRILRPGFYGPKELAPYLPQLAPFNQPKNASPQPTEPLRSPGLLTRHYAPRIPLLLNQSQYSNDSNSTTAWLLFSEGSNLAKDKNNNWYLGTTPHTAESRLYASLWEAQTTEGVERICVEPIPDGPEWDALRDRLGRAAAT